ncbi:MAG TPA: anti-sigma factor [Gemmatimonas sp.]|nr:anti-sigma factor [Gemmatimonas sp.]
MDDHEDEMSNASKDERAAAELTVAMSAELPPNDERMRAALVARIVADGEAMVQLARDGEPARRPSMPAASASLPARAALRLAPASDSVVSNPVRVVQRRDMWRWTGWLAAAAAMLLWAVGPQTVASSGVGPTPAELRASVLRGDSTATPIRWAATSDSVAHGATGDVVWSDRLQRGVLRIAGLQPNDRERWQYQLWIFDKTRNEKYPVDGGVFDVPPSGGEVLVPIAARLRVGNAVVFAVTVEEAGGVVVSARDRIALLAQRGG